MNNGFVALLKKYKWVVLAPFILMLVFIGVLIYLNQKSADNIPFIYMNQ